MTNTNPLILTLKYGEVVLVQYTKGTPSISPELSKVFQVIADVEKIHIISINALPEQLINELNNWAIGQHEPNEEPFSSSEKWLDKGKTLCQKVADHLGLPLYFLPSLPSPKAVKSILEDSKKDRCMPNPTGKETLDEASEPVNPKTLQNIMACLPKSLDLT